MMRSILNNYTELQNILAKNNEVDYMFSTRELSLMTDLCKVLENFERATNSFSSQTNCTISTVVMWHDQLVKHCEVLSEDSLTIKNLKKELTRSISKKWTHRLSVWHHVGLLFDPRYKRLAFLDKNDVENAINLVTDLLIGLVQERSEPEDVVIMEQNDDLFGSRMETPASLDNEEYARNLIHIYQNSSIELNSSCYKDDDGKFSVTKF